MMILEHLPHQSVQLPHDMVMVEVDKGQGQVEKADRVDRVGKDKADRVVGGRVDNRVVDMAPEWALDNNLVFVDI